MHWDDHVRALDKDMNRYYTCSMGVRWKSGHLKSGMCRHPLGQNTLCSRPLSSFGQDGRDT